MICWFIHIIFFVHVAEIVHIINVVFDVRGGLCILFYGSVQRQLAALDVRRNPARIYLKGGIRLEIIVALEHSRLVHLQVEVQGKRVPGPLAHWFVFLV